MTASQLVLLKKLQPSSSRTLERGWTIALSSRVQSDDDWRELITARVAAPRLERKLETDRCFGSTFISLAFYVGVHHPPRVSFMAISNANISRIPARNLPKKWRTQTNKQTNRQINKRALILPTICHSKPAQFEAGHRE